MRATWLTLLLSTSLLAQQKEVTFQEVTNAVVAGFSEDAKAERAWEMRSALMKPTAEAGTWDLTKLEGKSFKDGKVSLAFASPYGTLIPAKRQASGPAVFTARSPAFDLKGQGWTWISTPDGDRFSVLADVTSELNLDLPITKRLRIQSEHLEVSTLATGTLLVFTGKVVLNRFGEKMTCQRVECLLDDGPKGDKTCRSLRASGEVVRTFKGQTLRGDLAFFDQVNDRLTVSGRVRLAEPGLLAEADKLEHDAKTNITRLQAESGQRVYLKSTRLASAAAEGWGRQVVISRAAVSGEQTLQLEGQAEYLSEQGKVTAQRLVATESKVLGDILSGSGDVRGYIDGNQFSADQAEWNRTLEQLRLVGQPRLVEPRGFEVSGAVIRSDGRKQKVEVESSASLRAIIKIPAETEGGLPGVAQADRIFLNNEAGAVEADLMGLVRYVAADVVTESERMVAYARMVPTTSKLPAEKGASKAPAPSERLQVEKVFLTGAVRFVQPGLRCSAERIDYVPSVKIEEILKRDQLQGQPRLLTLSGGAGTTRPRLSVDLAPGQVADFIADAQEILVTPAMTKFFLRGAVGMHTENSDATCDLLEGLATAGSDGKSVARLIVGRGNVNVLAGGTTAYGRTLEIKPELNEAKLFGDARIRDALGREGIPAKEITYDMRSRNWRMDQADDPTMPGQVVRPKIFLGSQFTLPQVKSLDKTR